MAEPFEPKYDLFTSVEEMLDPETLSVLLASPVTHVACAAPEVWGNAGSEFTYVSTDVGRLILKRMSKESDYLMVATDDHRCRSVTLWQYGLLDQISAHLAHEIVACAHENDVWTILMQDLSGHFLPEKFGHRSNLMPTFLDAFARLHAEFWNDERLHDARLGLDGARIRVQLASPSFARKHHNDHWGWIPKGVIEGWEALEKLLEPDVMQHLKSLIENPQPLLDALQRYPYTLLHGDPYHPNLAHKNPNQAAAVDWQMAMCSLMTIDLARLVLDYSMDAAEQAQAQVYYRRRLERYLNKSFEDPEWQTMVDLGNLTEILTMTCFIPFGLANSDDPDFKHYAEMRLKACSQHVRDGIRWI